MKNKSNNELIQSLKLVNDLYNYDKTLFNYECDFYKLIKRIREQRVVKANNELKPDKNIK